MSKERHESWERIISMVRSANEHERELGVLKAHAICENALRAAAPSWSGARFHWQRSPIPQVFQWVCDENPHLYNARNGFLVAVAVRNFVAHDASDPAQQQISIDRNMAAGMARLYAQVWSIVTGKTVDLSGLNVAEEAPIPVLVPPELSWWERVGPKGITLMNATIAASGADPTWIPSRDVVELLPQVRPELWVELTNTYAHLLVQHGEPLPPEAKKAIGALLVGLGARSPAMEHGRTFQAVLRTGVFGVVIGMGTAVGLALLVWILATFVESSSTRAIVELVVATVVACAATILVRFVVRAVISLDNRGRSVNLAQLDVVVYGSAAFIALFGAASAATRAADVPVVGRALLAVMALVAFGVIVGFAAVGPKGFSEAVVFRVFKYSAGVALIGFAGAFGWGYLDSSTQFVLQVHAAEIAGERVLVVYTPRGGVFLAEDVLGTLAPIVASVDDGPFTPILPIGAEVDLPGYYVRYDPVPGGVRGHVRSGIWNSFEQSLPWAASEYRGLEDPRLIAAVQLRREIKDGTHGLDEKRKKVLDELITLPDLSRKDRHSVGFRNPLNHDLKGPSGFDESDPAAEGVDMPTAPEAEDRPDVGVQHATESALVAAISDIGGNTEKPTLVQHAHDQAKSDRVRDTTWCNARVDRYATVYCLTHRGTARIDAAKSTQTQCENDSPCAYYAQAYELAVTRAYELAEPDDE